ncbi:MAG: topology modulation protein [Hyphomicrobiaceae bacterium]
MRRILIIGPSGSGKSWLAQKVGSGLGLEVIHLDKVYWQPGWTAPDTTTWRERVTDLTAGDAWVMDGNYNRTLPARLQRAHAIIWLDLPRRIYFPRAVWRSLRHYGRVRQDSAEGCPERLDPDFICKYVWTYPQRRDQDAALMAGLPPHVRGFALRSRRDVRQFVAGLPGSIIGPPFAK